ncbi:hypothetical protein [Hyalangium gracile]|uniref:hypothetical protein n=1 Tax=Hyalangium gracile TaxID=394092 RepID=UPI001CCA112B|nr:hypothetical protein [Hyalangium gracile]
MSYSLSVVLFLALSACMKKPTMGRYVPPAEAAWFKFGSFLPEEGQQTLPGSMAVAIHHAAEHFLPWESTPPAGADAVAICLLQRQVWDVETAPWADNSLLIRFALAPGACRWGGAPLLDLGATYAVSLHDGRILAVSDAVARPEGAVPFQFPQDLPREKLSLFEANTAAAIELATGDFLAHARGASSDEPPCVAQLSSYDVTAVSAMEGVNLVRFDLNDRRCPPLGPPSIVEGRKALSPAFVTTYAIELRTMRILGIELTTRQRIDD